MPSIKLEIFIKVKSSKDVVNSLRVDDHIEKQDVFIISQSTDDGVLYTIGLSDLNIGFLKNTFNDIIICLKPILDLIEKTK